MAPLIAILGDKCKLYSTKEWIYKDCMINELFKLLFINRAWVPEIYEWLFSLTIGAWIMSLVERVCILGERVWLHRFPIFFVSNFGIHFFPSIRGIYITCFSNFQVHSLVFSVLTYTTHYRVEARSHIQ